MNNHPSRKRPLRTEVNGVRFKLSFDTTGNPFLLKQFVLRALTASSTARWPGAPHPRPACSEDGGAAGSCATGRVPAATRRGR
jgi:hypothetical protein